MAPGWAYLDQDWGRPMSSVERYRQHAADCVRQAQAQENSEDRTILLNMALAWLRLAQQVELREEDDSPSTAPEHVEGPADHDQPELTA
jgi:hypothetical protein